MPLCSLYLISLNPSTSISSFLTSLYYVKPRPLVVAKVVRWIIVPWLDQGSPTESKDVDYLKSTKWDLLIIYPEVKSLHDSLLDEVEHVYLLQVGIPSRITSNFVQSTNPALLHPKPGSIPELTGSLKSPLFAQTTQNLEFTGELLDWISKVSADTTTSKLSESSPSIPGAISMLNFLAFPSPTLHPEAHESYVKYGQAFAKDIGIRRGGMAKIVGNVIASKPTEASPQAMQSSSWNEIALAHYPTLYHFADMIASKDYQEANAKYRVGSLRGTGILCCNELDPDILAAVRAMEESDTKAKL